MGLVAVEVEVSALVAVEVEVSALVEVEVEVSALVEVEVEVSALVIDWCCCTNRVHARWQLDELPCRAFLV